MHAAQLAQSLLDRFEANVVRSDAGCWDWRGSIGAKGYTMLSVGQFAHAYGHRLSWEIHHGRIPAGMWVLHHCDNKRCTNPGHLYLGTQADNGRDIRERETSLKERCRRDHPLSGDNLYIRIGSGGYRERHCRECVRITQRERYQRLAAAS